MNKNFLKLFGIIILLLSCSSPKQLFIPKINDRLSADLNNNEISIITYNIQTVFGKGEEKVESLINYLNSANFDFVAMQEVFDENTRTNLVNRLNPISYKAVIPRVDYIFAYDNIGLISLRKVGATSINVTDIIDGNNSSLSDHLALKATIVF